MLALEPPSCGWQTSPARPTQRPPQGSTFMRALSRLPAPTQNLRRPSTLAVMTISQEAARSEARARGTHAARSTRDAALRRTRAIVAGVAAAAVGLSGALSVVAAQAFKGHPQRSGPSPVPVAKAGDRSRAPRVSVPRPQGIPSIDGQPAPLAAARAAPGRDAGHPAGTGTRTGAAGVGGVVSDTATCSSWRALGTSAAVVVLGAGAHDDARAAVEAELAEIDAACSRFREDSELSRVNAGTRTAIARGRGPARRARAGASRRDAHGRAGRSHRGRRARSSRAMTATSPRSGARASAGCAPVA